MGIIDTRLRAGTVAAALLIGLLGAGTASALPNAKAANQPPPHVQDTISRIAYDGINDDLLTAGLGRSGLAGAVPAVSAPPTPAELRRLAIYSNYRALVDMTPGGGYGSLYGPNVTADGVVTADEGLIAGVEYLAYGTRGKGRENVTLMVQIPDHFDPARPCIVTAPSSGSRGVYGAIATAGEWGLKRGCAVAYTDKGTGTGAHNLQDDTVGLITGERMDAEAAGKDSHFTARLSEPRRAAFNAETPNRFAFKHAHSGLNPEEDWGTFVLWSVEFAFYALNEEFGEPVGNSGKRRRTLNPDNTLVIASSVSNGGGASLRAAEQDRHGLIDAVVVSEPNVNPRFDAGFAIVQGDGEPLFEHSRSLLDYTTLLNVFQGCASLANPMAPLNLAPSADRCASLFDKGLLQSADLAQQAAEAQAIINAFGILPEQNLVQPSHWFANVPQSISVTYANSYSRAHVIDNLCAYSFGATAAGTNMPVPLPPAAEAVLFGVSNGIPPTGGVNLINNASVGGPLLDRASISPSTGRTDQNLDGALCLRALATGADPVTGVPLDDDAVAAHNRARQSIERLRAGADLGGRPVLIVTGRSDAILPPNHSSRAYYGLNQRVEGDAGALRYIEITNAQHLDAFNPFPGFDNRFIPLHHYFFQALDLMWAHLTAAEPLPPSQVVRTTPRGGAPGAAPAIDPLINLPPIEMVPADDALIVFTGDTLFIPE
ncbi:MAG TPA: 3-hydroxybutyrate oligomer hydrolase family protein [Rhodocyclaceae bacterium]|nr:3-hydroxybutyrate oligomer hydrolase family protein [Rhodocyclaceae bacterium]